MTPPPQYPEYALEETRLRSFSLLMSLWKKEDRENLAKNGFFFAGVGIICFHCGISISRWQAGEDAAAKHVRYNSKCEFIRDKLLNETDNDAVKLLLTKLVVDSQKKQQQRQRLQHFKIIFYDNFMEILCIMEFEEKCYFESESLKLFKFFKRIIPAGFTVKYVSPDDAILYSSRSEYPKSVPCEPGFADEMTRIFSLDTVASSVRDVYALARNGFYYSEADEKIKCYYCGYDDFNAEDFKRDKIIKNHMRFRPSCKLSSEKWSWFSCFFCKKRKIQVTFVPCGHTVSCVQCADKFDDCVYCNHKITEKFQIYVPDNRSQRRQQSGIVEEEKQEEEEGN